jgi:intracellular sulfur oxidation DsrE/DsrF family protein
MTVPRHNRRAFMAQMASAAGLAAVDRAGAAAQAATKWDLSWLDEFKGSHKQIFDYGAVDLAGDAAPLRFVRNFLDAHRDIAAPAVPQVNALVGAMVSAFPFNVSDAVWKKYAVGERWKILDPLTRRPAVRNVFLDDLPHLQVQGIRQLQSRGVVFYQCNNALGNVVAMLSGDTHIPARTVRAELLEGLNPGVRLVPAHVLIIGLAQERGFTYMKP